MEEGDTMKRFGLAASAAVAFALSSLGMSTSIGTAAADGLSVSPPAIIDADGFQSYATSSYPAASLWPG
jgi:hypothetical protein